VAIGSRLDQRWLRDWILDPRAQRSSARMPALLHGPQARPDAEAIAAYLASLRDPKLASRHEENAHAVRAAGERAEPGSESGLIGKLRCGGCHVDQSQAADDGRLSMQARKFLPGSLAAYLEDPTAHYPWNPMPHFRLSRGEAQELEAALRLEGGRRARPTAASPPGEQMLARGRDLVETTGCLNCHEAPGTGLQNRAALATSFTGRATSSCLLGTGPARHAFRPQEIAQLQQFLAGGLDPLLRHVPAEFAARQVRQLRCNGCHGHFEGIPDLDRLGEKLRPEWMAAFLAGRIPYKPRGEAHPDGQPWLPARMPAFPAQAQLLAAGLAAQAGYPAHTPADNRLDPALAETGATLVSARGGFSCVACHGVGNQPPTQVFEAEGINLKYSAERLRPEFFRRWLLDPMRVDPSTRMPNYFDETGKSPLIGVLGGQADAQIEAIWHYLRQLGGEKPDVPRTSATKPPVIPVASAP
jgi:cytochrome c553